MRLRSPATLCILESTFPTVSFHTEEVFPNLESIAYVGAHNAPDQDRARVSDDQIRQNEGFKNLHFSNIIKAFESSGKFIAPKDSEILNEYSLKAKDAQVIFHELLGHGTGKLLQKKQDGTFNFKRNLIDPFTGRPVSSPAPALVNELGASRISPDILKLTDP